MATPTAPSSLTQRSAGRQGRVLRRHPRPELEASAVGRDETSGVVVEDAAQRERVLGVEPIEADHAHGVRRHQHADVDPLDVEPFEVDLGLGALRHLGEVRHLRHAAQRAPAHKRVRLALRRGEAGDLRPQRALADPSGVGGIDLRPRAERLRQASLPQVVWLEEVRLGIEDIEAVFGHGYAPEPGVVAPGGEHSTGGPTSNGCANRHRQQLAP